MVNVDVGLCVVTMIRPEISLNFLYFETLFSYAELPTVAYRLFEKEKIRKRYINVHNKFSFLFNNTQEANGHLISQLKSGTKGEESGLVIRAERVIDIFIRDLERFTDQLEL